MAKYNSIENIPASVFFEILKSKNYQLLKPKPSEQGVEAIFVTIYDEFFIKSNNYQAVEYLELTNQISYLNYKINILKQSLHFYLYNKTTEQMRFDFIASLKKGYDIEINPNLPFINEVLKILNAEIGLLNNDLEFLNLSYNEMINKIKSKPFDFYEQISYLSNVLQNNSLLTHKMTLAVYISLEKLANKIVEQNNNKK